jgi:ribA/ribD-fused uncharacterized protein
MNAINFIEEPRHWLSPFSPHSIDIWGRRFATVEHAYHCSRFQPGPAQDEIFSANSPLKAWKLSQKHKENPALLTPGWDKEAVMKELFRAKLAQHDEVREFLISTGDATLLKVWPTDYTWGTGADGTGENRMGKLWMELREELLSA